MNKLQSQFIEKIEKCIDPSSRWILIHSSLFHFRLDSNLKWDLLSVFKSFVDRGYTLAFPSFTFSFTKGKTFDPYKSVSETGVLSDWILELFGSIKTNHPIYSHVLIGNEANEALKCSTDTCFGKASIFSLFEAKNASIVMFGCSWEYCTPFHFFEEEANVPYRYLKTFKLDNTQHSTQMFVRNLEINAENDFSMVEEHLRKNAKIKSNTVGNGTIEGVSFKELALASRSLLKSDILAFVKDREVIRIKLERKEKKSLNKVKIAILGEGNLDSFKITKTIIEDTILDCEAHVYINEFGQMRADVIEKKVGIFEPDFCFLPSKLEDLFFVSHADLIKNKDLGVIKNYCELIKSLSPQVKKRIFVHSFLIPSSSIAAPPLEIDTLSIKNFFKQANQTLEAELKTVSNVSIISSELLGLSSTSFDPRLWYLGRITYAALDVEKISEKYLGFILSELGKTVRVVVLDLDQTLWGGVLGEDGPSNIQLGGDFPGNAFKDFQKLLLTLKDRGILLTVVSKNNEEEALKVLNEHEEMVIRTKDLSSHRINWNEKFANIISLSEELSLGLSSFLLVDDNNIEREKVRKNLPEVRVLNLPRDPAFYCQALLNCPFILAPKITNEDLLRSKSYETRKVLNEEKSKFNNIEDFLKSLKIKIVFSKINQSNHSRAIQLIAKTNQYNTTTIRYSDTEFNNILESKNHIVRIIGYKDNYSEFENIGLIILKIEHKQVLIESFLLSCRVLGRQLENVAMYWVHQQAKLLDCNEIKGEIKITAKNLPVQSFYKNFGFKFSDTTNLWSSIVSVESNPLPGWLLREGFVNEA